MSELVFHPAALIAFGLIVGFFGTLVGVGGGFFMVPYFTLAGRMLHPAATVTSLAVIVFSAISGSIRLGVQKRIDYIVGIGFGLATIPGTLIGAEVLKIIQPRSFKLAFAGVVAIAAYYLIKSRTMKGPTQPSWFQKGLKRETTDATGATSSYEVNLWFGIAVSVAVGFVSKLFGVGGGFLHVPMMILIYGMPVHVAVATSQFILAITALAGVAGDTGLINMDVLLYTAIGAVVGAQAGAAVAPRVSGGGIKIILAVVLLLVAASMLASGLGLI